MRTVIHVLDNFATGGCQTCLRAHAAFNPKPRRHIYVSLRSQAGQISVESPDVYIFPETSRYSLSPIFRLLKLTRKAGPAILHCYLFKAQVCGLLVRLLRPSTRLIFHESGRILNREDESWAEAILYRQFLRISARGVDLFIANSKHTLSTLQKFSAIAARPSVVVYNSILQNVGIPSSIERRKAREALGLPINAFIFGFAGRLVERKGWRDFVSCADRFRDRADVYWLIAGDGPDRNLLEQLKRQLGLERIINIGFAQSMDPFYRSIDACIIPSHWEPHGLVQIEAQSYGIPVIAADVPGMNETLDSEKNALLFEPRDLPSLYNRIASILSNPSLLAALSAASIQNAIKFSLKSYHDDLERCYERF